MDFILSLIVIAVLVIIIWTKVSEHKDIKKLKDLISLSYNGDSEAQYNLGLELSIPRISKKWPYRLQFDQNKARKLICYALSEKNGNSHATSSLKYEPDQESVALAREVVSVCFDKYGSKGSEKVLDTILAKNFNLNR